ncbi:MAG: carboxylate--amine ligase [Clostridiales Family XIII bacterium]|nr:carboxylate--amine ligase [Clostridia bacterium]MDE8733867.1 carboxylate--amine ligase [Eubacteriales bacterium DFI.9.88]MDY3011059.1 carboxylate--amine ligase [Clostridiales Family XIII bacterium]
MKKILVLGAGLPQVPLILKAKEMGLYTMVSSIEGNYPGFRFADRSFYIDTTDSEAILQTAKAYNIDAIITAGTDVAVNTIGYVCDQLGLPGITSQTAKAVTDKSLMKKKMVEGNVNTSQFVKVESLQEALESSSKIGYPVMFKCADKSGSRGIIKVDSMDDVEAAYQYARSYTQKNYIVVEKFVCGIEIGLDGYTGQNSEFYVPYEREVYNNGHTDIPLRHILPLSKKFRPLEKTIIEEAQKAVKALGIKNSFFNMDIIVNLEKGYANIIEVGARTGGAFIPEVIANYYNFDLYEKMILNSLGKSITFPSKPNNRACISELLISEKDGIVEDIVNDYVQKDQSCMVILGCDVGDVVKKFKIGSNVIGGIVVSEQNIDEARHKLDEVRSKVNIIIK